MKTHLVGRIGALIGLTLAPQIVIAQQVTRTPVDVVVPILTAPVTALGRTHWVYELHLTNQGTSPLVLHEVGVENASGVAIDSWSETALASRFQVTGSAPGPRAPSAIIPAGRRGVVFVWLSPKDPAAVGNTLVHRLVFSSGEGTVRDTLLAPPVALARSEVERIALPVRGGPWVMLRGPSNTSGHRLGLVTVGGTTRVPQRFAIDFAKFGTDGRLFGADSTRNEAWYGYADSVFSATDGQVVLVRDGIGDNVPLSGRMATEIDAKTAPGNLVSIGFGDGRFASYSHLKAGSIRVKQGDRVTRGQLLGLVGNSGNSGGPHLHFQISAAAEVLFGEGLPFAFEEFRLLGRLNSMGSAVAGRPWTPNPAQPSRDVRGEIPLENMVISVPAAPRN
ncbi:MAG: M23 family metallopeptidase [Gemmatimonadales bacterium]